MKKFITNTIIFLVPILLFYVFPIAVLYLSKEFLTYDQVVKIQNENKDIVYGNAYNMGSFVPYKKALFDTNNPEVFTLGSSRALQIRKEFFKSPEKFINAGLAGRSFGDMKYFLENTATSSQKRVLLLVIDREMFFLDPNQADAKSEDYTSILGFNFNLPLSTARGIYLDYFLRNKYSFKNLIDSYWSPKTLGIRALGDGNGFRSDGSYINKAESKDPNRVSRNQSESEVVAENILKSKEPLLGSDEKTTSQNMEFLKQILEIAKSKNISIFGIIPPYPTPINQTTFNLNSKNGTKYVEVTNRAADLFKENNSEFYDLSDITKYSGLDSEFIDPIHGSDVMYAKMCLYLSEHSSILKTYFDADNLRNMLRKASGDFLSI